MDSTGNWRTSNPNVLNIKSLYAERGAWISITDHFLVNVDRNGKNTGVNEHDW